MADVVFLESDSGRSATVKQGARVSLRLKENATTGYRWTLRDFTPGVLRLDSDTTIPPGSGGIGAAGERRFVFVASAPGQVRLALEEKREWEANKAIAAFTLSVSVE